MNLFPTEAKAQSGLSAPVPVAPYLDGAFPDAVFSGSGGYQQVNFYPGLSFVEPIRIVEHPIEDRLVIVGKDGLGWTVSHTEGATDKTLFFDISSIMHGKSGNGEGGISDIAFHPEFGQAGSPNANYVYITYRWSPTQSGTFSSGATVDGYNRLSRFSVVNGQVDLSTELLMISQYDRQQWHIGGDMFFGNDGFLYISSGDEGNCCSKLTSTQRLDGGLFSGIMRIDVDMDPSRSHPIRRQPTNLDEDPSVNGPNWPASVSQNYFIPNDNPFLDPDGSILEEFYSIGLRHPWTISYDELTGHVWAADVGQSSFEEVNRIDIGDNNQWGYKEGFEDGVIPTPATIIGNEAPPVFAYPRATGQAVIGAGVYRGGQFPEFYGKYLFSDFVTGLFWSAEQIGITDSYNVQEVGTVTAGFPNGINSYLMDSKGNILLAKTAGGLNANGEVQVLRRLGETTEPPALLSDTGAFANLATLEVHPGCVPYDMNVPFWSDAALKSRWLCLPNDGSHNTAAEKISFSEDGDWSYPVGTVTIKHFELQLDETDPNSATRLETRFFVHGTEGWYGVTYRWNEAGTDAELLATGETEEFTIQTASGPRQQTWTYPSRGECLVCHSSVANFVLGPSTRQLNKTLEYPATGITANQLVTFNALGMFDQSFSNAQITSLVNNALTSSPTDDLSLSLSDRARSYLDSNCGYCHLPGGVRGNFDARLVTPFHEQGMVLGEVNENIGITNPFVIAPGDLSRSILHVRANSAGLDTSMPPLAKDLVDEAGMAVITEWLNALAPFEIGNDTTTDGNFIDGHHPSLYVNESDTHTQTGGAGTVVAQKFKFFARRLGNPITPLILKVDGDNQFTVLAIGTTRTSADYSVGENIFDFAEGEDLEISLANGDTIVTGFMDMYPNGTGWGAGTVIPADTGAGADEIYGLLPAPLIGQANGFVAGRDAATVVVGQPIATTNAGKALNSFNLARSYKFAVTFGADIDETVDDPTPGTNELVNGSFEEPVVTKWSTFASIPGWTATQGVVEVDRTPWPASDGDQSSDLNGHAPTTIEQTVSLTPGATYQLSYEYGARSNTKGQVTADVLVNGVVVSSIVATAATAPPNYASASVDFVAPASGDVTIAFASTNAGSTGVILDNVAVVLTAPPPEPFAGLVNGSFEEPVVSKWSVVSSLPGWDIVTGPVEIDRTPWPAAEGDQSMDLNASSGSEIAQTVTGLIPGEDYVLTFQYGAHFQVAKVAGQLVHANVIVDGNIAAVLTAGVNDVPPAYQTEEVIITAPSSGEVTIGFVGSNAGGRGVVIDNVVLEASDGGSTPIPTDPDVVNGSFELPDLSEDPNLINRWDYVPSIPGWTTVQGEIEVMGPPSDGGAWPASVGEQSLDLGAAAGAGPDATIIEQEVPGLVPGITYNLTFDFGKHTRTQAEEVSANVYIDGQLVGSFVADDSMEPPNYQQAVVPFVATGTSVTIAFEHTTPVFHQGLTLDNVDISVADQTAQSASATQNGSSG
ncbi:MAG: DUF642 domain-containing protein [Pseudomonadota bacterium]